MYPCHYTGGNQEWRFENGQIKHHRLCVALSPKDHVTAILAGCDPADESQLWTRQGLLIRHSKFSVCLNSNQPAIYIDQCDEDNPSQQFTV